MNPHERRRGAAALSSAALASVVVLAALLGATGCEQRASRSVPRPDTTLGPVPDQVSWNASYAIASDGRLRARLQAGRMEQYRAGDSTYSVLRSPVGAADTAARVQIQVYDEAGDSSATIVSNRVVQEPDEGTFDAYGDVVVTTPEGRRLESEHLTWYQADRKIRTRRFVRITTPTEQVQGNGLVADENLETYQIGRFTANVEVDDDTPGDTTDGPPPRSRSPDGGGEAPGGPDASGG